MQTNALPSLDYESPRDDTALQIEQSPDGTVTITVPTHRTAARFVGNIISAELLAIIFAPLLWAVFKLFATRKPRAVLRLTSEEFIIRETSDDGLGYDRRTRSWPLAEIGELRPNRFSNGLYLTLNKRDSLDLLTDIPAAMVAEIGTALAEARQRLESQRPLPTSS